MMQEVIKPQTRQKLAFKEIPVMQLKAGQYQPRQVFAEEGLKSLAETIKRVGVLEPLLVRPLSSNDFEIIAGERRWRAAKMAVLKTVPCLVGSYDDEQASQIALIENLNREDLNPIDEAAGINRLVLEFKYKHEEMAAILGKTRSHITNLLRLLKLDTRVQEMLMAGKLPSSQGKILAGLPIEKQYFFAGECIEKQWSMRKLSQEIKSATEKNKKNINPRSKKNEKNDVDIVSLEKETSDQFGHEIKFFLEKNKSGYVKINFCNLDELEAILHKFKKQ